MGDHHGRGRFQYAPQRRLHQRLRMHIQSRERVVEHQEARLSDDGAGQCQALPLTAGEAETLLADLGVEAVRQVVHEVGLRDRQRPPQLLLAGTLGAHENVVPDARREERRLLERHGHQLTQPFARQGGDVGTVQRDPPGGDVVKSRYERGERRLPGSGGPDQGHRLAGADP